MAERDRKVVFEVTDEDQVFAVHQDGTGLRQLTNARGYTSDAPGAVTVELPYPFAHPGHAQL